MLTNYIGDLDFARLREGLGKLQLRYRELGFPTISVTLPQQKLTNGIVRVKVIEGKISDIVVDGQWLFQRRKHPPRAAEPYDQYFDEHKMVPARTRPREFKPGPADLSRHQPRPRTGHDANSRLKVKDRFRCTDTWKSTTSHRPARHCCDRTRRCNTTISGSSNIRLASTTIFRRSN